MWFNEEFNEELSSHLINQLKFRFASLPSEIILRLGLGLGMRFPFHFSAEFLTRILQNSLFLWPRLDFRDSHFAYYCLTRIQA